MRPRFIDTIDIDDLDTEPLTEDNTIGHFQSSGGDVRGQGSFGIYRLREAIIAFEREFGNDVVEIGLVTPNGLSDEPPLLVLVPSDGDGQAIVLAPRVSPGWEPPEAPIEEGEG